MPIRLVYIAGPYRAASAWEVACNIHRAREHGARVVTLGAYPVIPHSNTAHFDGLTDDEMFWLDGTLELMRRCDAVLLTEDWQRSSGARREREDALARGIPVFNDALELEEWLIETSEAASA